MNEVRNFSGFPELGCLEIIEVYAYYDEAVLYVAHNERDRLFLVTLADDTEDVKNWLYAPMSDRRFNEVRSGGIELRQAFKAAEGGYVYTVSRQKKKEGAYAGKWVKTGDLSDNELPEEGVRLDLPTVTIQPREPIDVVRNAQQINKEVLSLAFNFKDSFRTEAPAGLLGQLLDSFQQVAIAVGQTKLGKGTLRGLVPANIVNQMTLSVAGIFPSSFAVELHANKEADLFGVSPVAEALEEVFRLFESSYSNEELIAVLRDLKGRTPQKYKQFLERFEGGVSSLEARWGSPVKKLEQIARVTDEIAFNAVKTISEMEPSEPIEYTFLGRLIGINIRTKIYEVWDVAENRKYSGKILDEAVPMVEHATINNVYSVTVREDTVTSATGELETKYRLLQLVGVGDTSSPNSLE
ncbi:MAG TPA: DUF6575 domain-containing protein [bacterium]|nr:DUF6575 domain-containing protein [bacterium]